MDATICLLILNPRRAESICAPLIHLHFVLKSGIKITTYA